ncbi:MAG TPA: cysteine desulfurase family protein [Candidatus Saccharimonadales bacterium]|nr:cysteine desulfurase family protein [Candidatus Saccharimonadales bacterium]
MSETIIYLDHAAATPLDQRVFEAMRPYMLDQFYNPSAAYAPARQVRTALSDARHRLAIVIGAKESEVVLTAGATESINLAIHGVMSGRLGNVIIGATEHASVRAAAEQFGCRLAEADKFGIVKAGSIEKLLDDNTCLISLSMADNEIGAIQPVKEVAELVRQVRTDRLKRGIAQPLYLHSDGSQAAGQLDLNVARLGVDLLTLNAAKCYGPKQTGLLFVRTGLDLEPLIRGGGQERNLRSGTENVAGAVGFAVSLEIAESRRHRSVKELSGMRQQLADKLVDSVDGLEIDGHPKRHLPGILHISLAGLDAERVVFGLDTRGVMVATGAACAANKGTRSNVLQAIGMSPDQADGSLRISLGRTNTPKQVEKAASLIAAVINREREL